MLRITRTENGMVKGLPGTDARITVFRGLPYAADPTGENRWRPPQQAENWEGIRECFESGPICMQAVPGLDPEHLFTKEWNVDPELPMSEAGSLCLNIWTPAKSAEERLPVLIWIHGGELWEGNCSEMEFDGERMAHRGIVTVNIAYRLNVFGFLAHPELTAENPDAPTNFGFLDQRAAFRWVQRNISYFGGDPSAVTIAGQSSGGVSVLAHMCSKQSAGLFQRAIIQSSAGGTLIPVCPKTVFHHDKELYEAEQIGEKFFRECLGVGTLAEARALPAEFIRDKALPLRPAFSSVVDHSFLESEIGNCIINDGLHRVPVMIGWTGDEFVMAPEDASEDALKRFSDSAFTYAAEEFRAVVEEEVKRGTDRKKAASVNINETAARAVADLFNEQNRPVYIYSFDPEIPGDDVGSFHSSDLWFTFETLMKCWRPFDGHHYDLARKMCNYWTNFVKTGDPNGKDADGTPMPEWKPYTPENRRSMNFFDEISMQADETPAATEYVTRLNLEAYKKISG